MLPPFVVAVAAGTFAVAWQLCGACLMHRALPVELPARWRFLVAWHLWLPVSGAVVLALSLAGLAHRPVLLALMASAFVLVAINPAWRTPLGRAGQRLRQAWGDAGLPVRVALVVAVLIHALWLVVAAHPQRMYDQLNYHLMVPRLVVERGTVFGGAWDPHVVFTGVIDHGFTWARAFVDDGLFTHGAAQVAVFLCTLPPIVGLAFVLFGGAAVPAVLALLLASLPSMLPSFNIYRMAKPDGMLMTSTLLLMVMRRDRAIPWLPVAMGTCLVMSGTKLTSLHASLAIFVCALLLARERTPWRAFMPALVVAAAVAGLQLTKNALWLGNPFYPSAASVFPSEYSDAWTTDYWHQVAYPSVQTWPARFLGPWFTLEQAPVVALWLLAAIVLGARHKRMPPVRMPLIFVAVYAAAWPLFYGSDVFPRFVTPMAGALLAIGLLGLVDLPSRTQVLAALALTVAGIGTSRTDMNVNKLVKMNAHNAVDALALDWPRMHGVPFFETHFSSEDTIVADAPEKVYIRPKVLFEEPLSPQERAVLEALRTRPIDTAKAHRIGALVVSNSRPVSARMQTLWDALSPIGRVVEVGSDRILWSACHFERPGCE